MKSNGNSALFDGTNFRVSPTIFWEIISCLVAHTRIPPPSVLSCFQSEAEQAGSPETMVSIGYTV